MINMLKPRGRLAKFIIKISLALFLVCLPEVSFASSLVANNDSVSTYKNESLIDDGGVLTNDTGGTPPLTAVKTSDPSNGSLEDFNSDGTFSYSPSDDFVGEDSFTYMVSDSLGATSTATVTITVSEIIDTIAPSIPGNLVSELTASSYLRLRWSPSSDDTGGSGLQGYNIYKKSGGNYTKIADINSLTYLDSGLSPSTTYFYKVSAYDKQGNEATSTELSVTTVNKDSYGLILDTGLPSTAGTGNSLNGMSFAHKFTLTKTEEITKLSAYLTNISSAQNHLTFVIYSNFNNAGIDIPYREIATTSLIFTPSMTNEASWRDSSNLNIVLPAESYWFAIEYRVGDTSDGYLPQLRFDSTTEASRPVSGTYGTYSSSTLQHGFRIYSVSGPVISNVSSANDISTNDVFITWTTNKTATSVINYGLTTGYGSSSSSSLFETSHSMRLSGLTDSTTYHFKILNSDSLGNINSSIDYTFDTKAAASTPPVVSGGGGSSSGGGGGGGSGGSGSASGVSVGDVGNGVSAVNAGFTTPGCLPGDKFSSLTGKVCVFSTSSVSVPGCFLGAKFNILTGQLCPIVSTFSLAYKFTRDLKLGMQGEDVKQLQIFLNSNGFIVSTTLGSSGSKGYESTYFGYLTKQALIKFQQLHNITPTAGYFGAKTKKVIDSMLGR